MSIDMNQPEIIVVLPQSLIPQHFPPFCYTRDTPPPKWDDEDDSCLIFRSVMKTLPAQICAGSMPDIYAM